ncbi:MAG: hypothetical protein Ct9H300mP28_21390 [Pseudomonadota bacterium]|nr:MAG: hypothetical protein Ct9H300mP28_21390 [Pseudomonadota bacterium]
MIASHFTYAGVVLTDEQLEELSPLDITAMRHSEDMEILSSSGFASTQKNSLNPGLQQQEIPFLLVFFKSVQSIKRTSVQIVSYVRNNKKYLYVHLAPVILCSETHNARITL